MDICYRGNALTADVLISLRSCAGWGTASLPQAQKALSHTLFSIVAYDQGRAVGIGRLVGDGALIWYIQDLVVLPEYRGRGIGSAMLEKLIGHAVANSLPGSVAGIALMAAKGKEPFYQKFGFDPRPNESEGAGMMMRRKI